MRRYAPRGRARRPRLHGASLRGYNYSNGSPFGKVRACRGICSIVHGGPLTRDESSSAYAVIRHNIRTYESNGVVQVIRGKDHAETTVKQYEVGQSSEDRHAGWRYFIEKTSTAPGTNPAEATRRREAELDLRERKALEGLDS